MKKIIAMLLLLFAHPVQAGWVEDLRDASLFAIGIFTGLLVHEAGHVVAAKLTGESLSWENAEWICRLPCENLGKVAVAGNLATAVVGEVLIHADLRNPFVDGMQVFNTVNPIGYAAKDILGGGHGDYTHVSNSVEIALAIHAASIGYRQFSDRLWSVSGGKVQLSMRF